MTDPIANREPVFLPTAGLQSLLDVLRADGRTVVGPTVDQSAIVYDELTSVDELPRGWTDRQEAAVYRLERRDDDQYFGYVVGPHSWKKFLFPPHAVMATADRTEQGWELKTPEQPAPRYAFLGVRACELAAIRVQDEVFTGGPFVDPIYRQRRDSVFLVAVNCTQAASTCFCSSMNTGPRCRQGFDLALTELSDGFVVEVGSQAGAAVIDRLETRSVTSTHLQSAEDRRQQAVDDMSENKSLDTNGLPQLLAKNLEHPHWASVAERCLSCTNCTMVCPTCFCSSVEEVADLSGDHVERQRQWDSCFNIDFSFMSHGVERNSIRSRYRQWLTHKLSSWHDQFGTSGCVGCGRCITWCPVGIDLRDEVDAFRSPFPELHPVVKEED